MANGIRKHDFVFLSIVFVSAILIAFLNMDHVQQKQIMGRVVRHDVISGGLSAPAEDRWLIEGPATVAYTNANTPNSTLATLESALGTDATVSAWIADGVGHDNQIVRICPSNEAQCSPVPHGYLILHLPVS